MSDSRHDIRDGKSADMTNVMQGVSGLTVVDGAIETVERNLGMKRGLCTNERSEQNPDRGRECV